MNSNPIEDLLEWYDHINENHQVDLAQFLLPRLPNDGYTPDEEEAVSDFRVWLTAETKPSQVVGKVLTARSLINYHIEEHGNAQSWNFPIDIFLEVINDDEENELTKAFARDRLVELPQQRAEWMETASSWRKLIRNSLSNKSLHEWERMNMIKESV